MTFSRRGAWAVFVTALLIVAAWPPENDRSLLVKLANWAVDPANDLPFLPPQLDFGLSDDPQAVEMRDELVHRYDIALNSGAFNRWRLTLKTAQDPFNHATERQLLLLLGVIVTFVAMKRPGRP
jgi:hypothetical protein